MPSFNVTINPDLKKLGRAYRNFATDIDSISRKFVQEFSFLVESYSKQVAPVDTGRMRSSISPDFSLLGKESIAEIGTHNIHYAKFVHEGTVRMRARPFMLIGANYASYKFNGGELGARLDKGLREALSKL